MNLNNKIFELVKNHKWGEITEIIKNNKDIDLNIRDDNYNYLIQYLVIYNKVDLVVFLLKYDIKLDIKDSDGRTILYFPIKFNYLEMFKLLILSDKEIIGMSIIDNKDMNGYTPIHYSIIFENYEMFKLLLDAGSDLETIDNFGNTALFIAIIYNRIIFVEHMIKLKVNLNHINKEGETPIIVALLKKKEKICELLLKTNLNLNIYELVNKLSPLIIATNFRMNDLIKIMVNNGVDINHQDFTGNSALHYCIIENNWEGVFLLIDKINKNLINLEGNTPLHLIIQLVNNESPNSIEVKIAKKLMRETNVNIQNSDGSTVLHILAENKILHLFVEELKMIKIDIFIKNRYNVTPFDLDKNLLVYIAVDSYYDLIQQDKIWLDKWENECKIKLNGDKNKCITKIKNTILNQKKSFPTRDQKNTLFMDNGIFVDKCTYVGVGLDLVCGMIFLQDKFNFIGTSLTVDFELNKQVEEYYDSLGITSSFKTDFLNFEILWIYQKLFLFTSFDDIIKKLLESQVEFIVIPIGIEMATGSHSNIIIWDVKNKKVERFEPYGAIYPNNFYYNPFMLDNMLELKFKKFGDIVYYPPNSFLPILGFQSFETTEDVKCGRIGDPNGFCAIWCVWWVYHKMLNKDVPSDKLALKLLKKIKLSNLFFRNLIRNFSINVTQLRDNILLKASIDINDWMNGDFEMDKYDLVVKTIRSLIN